MEEIFLTPTQNANSTDDENCRRPNFPEPTLARQHASFCRARSLAQVGGQAFLVSQAHVDGVSLVSEKYIALAVLRLLEMEKFVVEGGGATGLAAILPGGPLNTPALKGETRRLSSSTAGR